MSNCQILNHVCVCAWPPHRSTHSIHPPGCGGGPANQATAAAQSPEYSMRPRDNTTACRERGSVGVCVGGGGACETCVGRVGGGRVGGVCVGGGGQGKV